nr:asparagine synthase [Nitrosopumilus sp.]
VLGYIPSPYSLYNEISKLPKSSYLEFDLTSRTSKLYTYQADIPSVTSEEDYAKLIERKVLDHLIADVPVGVFFSGGTDSSLIAAILHKNNINLETFSIGIDYKNDDKHYFKEISNYLKLKSHVYSFDSKEFDEVYDEVMDKMDEPTYDNSLFPTYFVSKKAAEKVKVVLSGEGGDEFFYGYPRSLVLQNMGSKRDYSITLLDRLFFLLPAFKSKNFLFLRLFEKVGQPMSYYILHMSPARDCATLQQWKEVKKEFQRINVSPLGIDQEFYLENDLLRKTDFATSYVSIEGRVPLLDVDIIGNAHHFENKKIERGVLKSFLKKILTRYLPENMVYRNKSGFGLDMVKIFKNSSNIQADFDRALSYLKNKGISIKMPHARDVMMRKHPHYCFALISLYRSISNNESL